MTRRLPPVKLVPATHRHRDFVRRLSAEVFSRFGDYDRTLPVLIQDSLVRTVVAQARDGAVGFAMYSPEDLPPGEIDLLAIAVTPEWQSRGVGRFLLEHVETAARRLAPGGVTPCVRITVAEDNRAARSLFETSGYLRVPGEQSFYAGGQPSMAMCKRLAPLPGGES